MLWLAYWVFVKSPFRGIFKGEDWVNIKKEKKKKERSTL
jgi:hypothetical protein